MAASFRVRLGFAGLALLLFALLDRSYIDPPSALLQLLGTERALLNVDEPPAIPQILWFTYKHNILTTQSPQPLFENTLNTIATYREAWNNAAAPVGFLDNDVCSQIIEQAEPKLLPYFLDETRGDLKGDVCRTAALYINGGYYFDVDMKVVTPLEHSKGLSFVTSSCSPHVPTCFFNSFIAAAPRHPILKATLDHIIENYENGSTDKIGCRALYTAYHSLSESQRGETILLKENNLNAMEHLREEYEVKDVHQDCNFVVVDESEENVYFYSRLPVGNCLNVGSLQKFNELSVE